MASNVILGYILTLLAVVHCAPQDAVKTTSLNQSGKCREETGLSLEDLVSLERWETLHASPSSKCLLYCAIHAWGAVKADETIEDKKVIEYFSQALKKEDQAKGIIIWDGCVASTKKDPDHCEFAYQLAKCFLDRVHKEKLQRIQFVKKDGTQE